jgi:hypothetical protein
MNLPASAADDPKQQALVEAVNLAKSGCFIDAYQRLLACGSLNDWFGSERTEIAWIVSELGAPRLSRWHTLKGFRETPDSLAVRNAYGSLIVADNGPLDTLDTPGGLSRFLAFTESIASETLASDMEIAADGEFAEHMGTLRSSREARINAQFTVSLNSRSGSNLTGGRLQSLVWFDKVPCQSTPVHDLYY